MHLHPAQARVEEVAHHTHAIPALAGTGRARNKDERRQTAEPGRADVSVHKSRFMRPVYAFVAGALWTGHSPVPTGKRAASFTDDSPTVPSPKISITGNVSTRAAQPPFMNEAAYLLLCPGCCRCSRCCCRVQLLQQVLLRLFCYPSE